MSDLVYIGMVHKCWSVRSDMNMMQCVFSLNEADLFPLSGSRTETVVCSSRHRHMTCTFHRHDTEEGFLISVTKPGYTVGTWLLAVLWEILIASENGCVHQVTSLGPLSVISEIRLVKFMEREKIINIWFVFRIWNLKWILAILFV